MDNDNNHHEYIDKNLSQYAHLTNLYIDMNNRINLTTLFQLKNIKLLKMLFLLEQINDTLFIDMGKDIQSFYHFYFENMSEPQIQDFVLRNFCYFRILSMIKDIIFGDISRNFTLDLYKIYMSFENVFLNDMNITWNMKLNKKDYVSQLCMKLKFLHNIENKPNNSIEIFQMVNAQINDTIGNNSIHSIQSLICNVYMKLLHFFSEKRSKLSPEVFKYAIDITLIFIYLLSFFNSHLSFDFDNIYQKEKQTMKHFKVNNVSLLLMLIGYKNLDLVHKVLSFFNVSNTDVISENNDTIESYVLLNSL